MEKEREEKGIPETPFGYLWSIAKLYRWWALISFVLVVIAQTLGSISAYILKELVDAVSSGATHEDQVSALFMWGIIYIVVLVVMYACWRGSGIVGLRWVARASAYSYKQLYRYLTLHSHAYFTNRFAGALSNKISNVADNVTRMLDNILWNYTPGIISILVGNALLYSVSVYAGLTFSLLIVLLFFLNLFLVKRRRVHVIAHANASSVFRGGGVDLLTNVANMRQFATRELEIDRLWGLIKDRMHKEVKRELSAELGMILNNILVVIALLLIMLVTYRAFAAGTMTTGDVVLVITVLFNTSYLLIFIGNMLNSFIRHYGEVEEGLEEVVVPHEIVDPEDAKELSVKEGEVVFRNVSFSHDTKPVFTDFNIKVKAGTRVGLVGHSGAGKSTFVSLLLRQHDLNGGSILVDGQDISQVTQDSLRTQIALVPQEPFLFHRSIKENIAYAKWDSTDDEVIWAAKHANAHDFIQALPKGYDTLVGERGVKLSGGERQRVAIARAFLKNAKVLLLDEATSSLDSISESSIQEALEELMEGKTVIAIAHRLSTLRAMDRILVIDQGQVIEDGTHDELLKLGGVYAELWSHQAGGFLQEE